MQKIVYYGVEVCYELTPQKFYFIFLKQMQQYFVFRQNHKEDKWALYLDLAKCSQIEGTVIPNLLIVGYIVGRKTNIKPILYISRDGEARVWNYLNDIHFMQLNEEKEIYEIQISGSSTGTSYKLEDYSTTTYLEKGLKEERLSTYLNKQYSTLFNRYFTNFKYSMVDAYTAETYTINILEVFCKQLCYNAVEHGESFCYTTMQVNHKDERIFISVSDCGKGMYATFLDKIVKEGYKPAILPQDIQTQPYSAQLDFRAIVEGLIYRFYEEKFGIWSVMTEIMKMKGIVRFHSGKARVNIADLKIEELNECRDQQEAALYLYEHLKTGAYVQKTPSYQGTHIELELPLNGV